MKKAVIIAILALVLIAGLTVGGIALFGGADDEPPVIDAGSIADRLNRAAENNVNDPPADDEIKADIDWWYPFSDEHMRLCGVWYDDDIVMRFDDDATVTVFDQLITVGGETYYKNISCGFWWTDGDVSSILMAASRQLSYDDDEVMRLGIVGVSDGTLSLTVGNDTLELRRGETVPAPVDELEERRDAVFSFSYAPSVVSVAEINGGALTIETTTTVRSGIYSWWGSSTDNGAAVTLRAADGTTLTSELPCFTADYTYVVRRAGDVIRGQYRFTPAAQKDGRIAPGVYDVILTYGGQTQTFEGGLTVTE